ncbi:MAG: hypothetical protein RLZZ591_2571 [Pseudomonadota bacterium]|jgi:membrane-associated phospholipid phosphatase
MCLVTSALAQSLPLALGSEPKAGERLGDWLARQTSANTNVNAYMPALHWQVPAERVPQQRLRKAVLQVLQDDMSRQSWPASSRAQLAQLLQSMPLTGRLTVALPDARWLQASPDQDPVLQADHRVQLFGRPTTVTVLTDTGLPCAAVHVSGALIQDYLSACLGADASQVDEVWLVQPDGRSTRYGVAAWNEQSQNEPAPGAWLWAPRRAAQVPWTLSDNLARFLATQPPGEFASPAVHGPGQPVKVAQAPVSFPVPSPRPAPRTHSISSSDWGDIGLLQTPTARMAPVGDARVHFSGVWPYTRGTVMLQPLEWLGGGFRYTDVDNRLYGPQDFSGNQSYKDKSLDFKLRLNQESAYLPEVAFGVRDLGGTGLFSSEYLVVSKRWGDLDFSLGLGWGYMAGRGNVKNPLSVFDKSFDQRQNDIGLGGTANTGAFLHGRSALFGGVQWQSPYQPLTLKLELDGNNYQHEPQANNQAVRSSFNVGAVYQYSPNIAVSMGLERGNRIMWGLTLHGGLNQLQSPKVLDRSPPVVLPVAPAAVPATGRDASIADMQLFTGWQVRHFEHQASSTSVVLEVDTALYVQERLDRLLRVLHRDSPASSRSFSISLLQQGLPMQQIVVNRGEWVSRHVAPQPPEMRLPYAQVSPGVPALPAVAQNTQVRRGLDVEVGPSFNQVLGGPDGFVLYQLGVQGNAQYRFDDSTWFYGAFNARLLDNFDQFTYTAPSNVPRVRTHQREYVTTSRFTLPVMQVTHVQDLGQGHYASVYGGMLESMFGGVGAEWLYRPWRAPIAVGVDVNHVRQRDFRQNLAFRNYAVNTGHATLYWDTGWNDIQVKISAGQYLAGDVGATLDVKRFFSNGVSLGGYATKTNLSAAQFGEGSFDKGLYVNIPFDAMLPRSTAGNANIAWSPLTRDGGARLNRRFPLFDTTKLRDPRALQWESMRQPQQRSAEDNSYVLSEPRPQLLPDLAGSVGTLGQQLGGLPASSWLWAGGAVLASSLLDKPLDKWAQSHAGGSWQQLGKATNAVPLALAAGAGVAYTGLAGEGASGTAQTAIKAASYTLAANLATRWSVGRARPIDGLGAASFDDFNSGALQSGFASNHVSVAFALATPFAQQYNMPWLYAAAASTALGRVQQRQHWVSDTVAGGLMGYAIGSLVNQTDQSKNAARWSVTPQKVQADWSF